MDSAAHSQRALESRLWDAANALRGPVDPADFKSFVFPILFFKWISDTWQWEHSLATSEVGPSISAEEEADYHRFTVPHGCHWRDVVGVPIHLGLTLRDALERLQEANPRALAGIFGAVDWADASRLPETHLRRLLDVFDTLTLDRSAVPHDMLGAAYEYLLRQFADESGRKAGEFFTPRPVVHLLVSLLAPQPGETVYDPACGSGGMLVETSNIVQAAGGDTRTLRLYGQEVNATTSAIARMNLFLHDLEDFEIRRDDTLRTPRHLDREGSLQTFDIVIANPPFSMRDWGADSWASDPFQRGFCGTPPAANADFAWVQHMIASMNETGRVGVVMPNGALFRGGAEKTIRRCLIDADLLEAVISLPGNLFYSTTIPACILLFRADKPTTSRGTVVLVDGSDRYDKGRNQNTMTADDLDAVLSATNKRSTTGDVAVRVVSLADIESAGWDLSVGRYLSGAAPDRIDVNAALIAYRTASGDLHNAEDALSQRLRAAGYE